LLEALIAGGAQRAVVALLYDPDSARGRAQGRRRREIMFDLGGKNGMEGHRPCVRASVSRRSATASSVAQGRCSAAC